MTRSPSAEPSPRPSKRKGARSVSTLTPSQLARKRANDREAQRAIRARTKEHIENLERQLEELKSSQSRDRTVQELMRRNRALEDELARLRESMGMPPAVTSPYSTNAVSFDDNHSAGSGTVPSPNMSPSTDYHHYQQQSGSSQYAASMTTGDGWAAGTMPSNVSSPSSASNTPDEYVAGYIPTSVPTTLMPSAGSLHSLDMNAAMHTMSSQYNMAGPHSPPHHQHQHHQQQQQHSDWGMYDMYYPAQMHTKGR
ncbi:hypothetical protein VHEMI03302 [[Torrubiella] hemipterigena]|uniref:BZIP transcription factor n=1 Tax=[Torrubiella] hemipterigena TaxID=1531966 RepID=A0A0A1TD18_9HYPO|nr:hypothetical protein VHEMI03302 [[Torrubiella] hemipterigena]